MNKYYYHVTDPKNINSIISTGLKSNEKGQIFVYDELYTMVLGQKFDIGALIAYGQLILKDFAIFRIDSSKYQKYARPDNVGEFVAPFHKIITKKRINPADIEFLSIGKTDYLYYHKFSEAMSVELTTKGKNLTHLTPIHIK